MTNLSQPAVGITAQRDAELHRAQVDEDFQWKRKAEMLDARARATGQRTQGAPSGVPNWLGPKVQ